MKIILYALLCAALCYPDAVRALTPLQEWARDYASQVGGKWSQTLVAIIAQEQSFCNGAPGDGEHIGCGQISAATANPFDPTVTEQDLRYDRARNIRDAAAYLSDCMAQTDMWARGVACYRYGLPVARGMTPAQLQADKYVQAIRQHMKEGA